jgi:hypothetical protein
MIGRRTLPEVLRKPDFSKNLVKHPFISVDNFGEQFALIFFRTNSTSVVMAKPKLTLDDLKVQSIVTSLDPQQMQELKGGFYVIRGRVFRYRARWTSVDTRNEIDSAVSTSGNNG